MTSNSEKWASKFEITYQGERELLHTKLSFDHIWTMAILGAIKLLTICLKKNWNLLNKTHAYP